MKPKKIFSLLIVLSASCALPHSLSGRELKSTIVENNKIGVVSNPYSLVTDSTNKAILLDEITLWADMKNSNRSPMRLKSVTANEIAVNAAGRTFPELMREIPGVYSTSESGSYGDAKLNIRGYKQENISVLLNGIPITGLVSGGMYWNNWMGLSDATAQIQLQKGIGGSMIADNSVGGTVNIVTKSPSERPSAVAAFNVTQSGTKKVNLEIGSGKLKRGWAFSLMGSYVWGKGWVEMTDVSSWAYMASISKQIGKKHSFLFTALGSPEKHEQRNTRLTYNEIEQYGRGYNKNWGYYTDENGNRYARTIGRNNYFKPYFTLNHSYKTNIGNGIPLQVNSALYFATAKGGGYWTESKGKRIIAYQKDGHIDWDAVVTDNRSAGGQAALLGKEGSATNILSDYLAGHQQYGAKSSVIIQLPDKFSFEAGLHYMHYRTWEKEKITDLLGGEYWYEEYDKNSLMGTNGRNPIKKVGDYIRTNNGRISNYGTVYAQAEYRPSSKLIVTGGASLNMSNIRRWDRYNYAEGEIYSKWARGTGGAVKGGVLYKPYGGHSVYLNAGYISKMPYYSVYFANGNNEISKDVKNEKNLLTEIGYRYVYGKGAVEINGYYTYWRNKTLMSNAYKPLDNGEAYKFMVTGLNARHYGVEFEAYHNFSNWIYASVTASHGVWRWRNNVHATLYDPYSGSEISKVDVYSNNLPVGDSPQSQLGGKVRVSPFKPVIMNSSNGNSYWGDILSSFTLSATWQYNTRYWADFEPSSRTTESSLNPYRIPSYHLFNLQFTMQLMPQGSNRSSVKGVDLFFNLNNLFDALYIERGKDGSSHTADSFTGYWGQGRNFNFGVRVAL